MKFLGVVTPWALTGAACGPSFQAVYECDVHFEHCYAVDLSDQVVAEKRLCWREWLAGYTYGQSRDRIEHARNRLAALSSDDSPVPSDAGSNDPVHSPLPLTAFSPPPRTSDDFDGGARR